jgi:hypothetical protein
VLLRRLEPSFVETELDPEVHEGVAHAIHLVGKLAQLFDEGVGGVPGPTLRVGGFPQKGCLLMKPVTQDGGIRRQSPGHLWVARQRIEPEAQVGGPPTVVAHGFGGKKVWAIAASTSSYCLAAAAS